MPHIFIRLSKFVFILILPFFLVSGVSYNKEVLTYKNEYVLQATGNVENDLCGIATFEASLIETVNGSLISTLTLNLISSTEQGVNHSIRFLVSKENLKTGITKGTYFIARNPDSFINSFNGVFAYANIDKLGEFPLFARRGYIKIDSLTSHKLGGYLNVRFNSAEGKQVHLKGNFSVTK